jgi:hypothetical protein
MLTAYTMYFESITTFESKIPISLWDAEPLALIKDKSYHPTLNFISQLSSFTQLPFLIRSLFSFYSNHRSHWHITYIMSGPPTLTDDAAPAHLDTSTPPSQDASPTPQNNQLDQNDLSTAFDKLQITDLTTQPTTVPIQDYDSDEYEAIQYESDESWDCSYHVHRMSKMDIRLYEERRVLERQEPIQAHLEALHQAFWNVDPEYTVFAFGGTIPKEEISCEELVLRVWKDAGKKEGDVKDNTDGGSGTNNGGNQEASIKDGEGEEEGLGDVQE